MVRYLARALGTQPIRIPSLILFISIIAFAVWSLLVGEIMQGLQVLSQLLAERCGLMYYEYFLISPDMTVKERRGFIGPNFRDEQK
jgi:hypothetical protein